MKGWPPESYTFYPQDDQKKNSSVENGMHFILLEFIVRDSKRVPKPGLH